MADVGKMLHEAIQNKEATAPEIEFRKTHPEASKTYTQTRLKGLTDIMRPYAMVIVNEARRRGYDFRIRETRRTKAQQAEKVKKGLSEKSSLTTSKHLTGEAFDLVFYKDGKYQAKAGKSEFLILQNIIKDLGLPVQQGYITDGVWKDFGHIQLPVEAGLYGGIKDWESIIDGKTR